MRFLLQLLAGICLAILLSSCTTDALTPQADIGKGSANASQGDNGQTANGNVPGNALAAQDQAAANNQPPQNTLQAQAQALENNDATTNQPVMAASTGANGSIRFLPIIGAPVQSVTPLSRQLGNEARAHQLKIKSSSDTTSDHILKGYLSAFNDGKKTTVVYVWDVLDASGRRLSRLQGQEEVPGAARDAWASVPPATMQFIATKTIQQYLQWKQKA